MPDNDFVGLLFVGDPHLATHAPGFRKDDYPEIALEKLRWAIRYARRERLLPVILGDVFHWPRDNGNRLLVELMELFADGVAGVFGNHDCSEDTLGAGDSLSVLASAGRYQLLSGEQPWRGRMNGTEVVLGGTSWGGRFPEAFEPAAPRPRLVFWAMHHDVLFPGYEEAGWIACREIASVDVVVNGHIHRPLPDVIAGATTWLNPGNIVRLRRSDFERDRVPTVLRIDVGPAGWNKRAVPVPYSAFDDVFHAPAEEDIDADAGGSGFVQGLAALEGARTAGGAGLRAFLDANLGRFESAVAEEVRSLAKEVTDDDAATG